MWFSLGTEPAAVGFSVALKCMTLRRSWDMTTRIYNMRNVAVGTVKKSIEASVFAWLLRNVRYVCDRGFRCLIMW
jgi:hypothetical protein